MAVKKQQGQEQVEKVAGKPVVKTAAKKPAVKKPAAKKPVTKATAAKPARVRPKIPYVRTNAPETIPEDAPLHVKLGILPRVALFCDFYLTHFNGAQAHEDAGFNPKNRNVARVEAHKILKRPNVRQYIAARMKATFDRLEDSQDRLLQTFVYTAYADPNELVENRIDCCRFCYGDGNQYQFTPQEFERHKEQHELDVREASAAGQAAPAFDPKGGIGFNPNNEPNEDCPECFGRGKDSTVFKDTRFLSPAALALYAGTKEGKDGKQILMHSQEKARETLAKVHKLYEDNATVNFNFDAADLEEKFGDKMRKAHERMQQMREERFGTKSED